MLTHARGDACHPMLPYLAQGANSAIEDGAVLGALLGHVRSPGQMPHALRLYEKLRKARGEAIVRETFKQVRCPPMPPRTSTSTKASPWQRESFHMPDGPEQEARDRLFLSQLGQELKGPFPSRWTCPEVQPWLYGYDAYEEVATAMRAEPFLVEQENAPLKEGGWLSWLQDLVPVQLGKMGVMA